MESESRSLPKDTNNSHRRIEFTFSVRVQSQKEKDKMANKVKVHITTMEGEVLESFEVVGGNVREDRPENAHPIKIADQIREHVSMRFEMEGE
jgi:hypothetical protein